MRDVRARAVWRAVAGEGRAAGWNVRPHASARARVGEPTRNPPVNVTAFYQACNDGLYSKAEQLASKESVDYIKATFALLGGLKGYCDEMTNEGKLARVEITGQTVRGEGARVTLVLHFTGGATEKGEESLVKTPAGWRLQVLGQGQGR